MYPEIFFASWLLGVESIHRLRALRGWLFFPHLNDFRPTLQPDSSGIIHLSHQIF